MNHQVIIFLTLSVLFNVGCKRQLKPAEYYAWNNSKNTSIIKTHKDKYYNFQVAFRPIDFMALSQLNGEKLTAKNFEVAKKGLVCCRHFKIDVQTKDTSDVLMYKLRSKEEYYERIKYLSTDISSHLYLIEGTDTLPCTFAHYERTYKMKSSATVMAFFERKDPDLSETTPMKMLITRGGFNPATLEFTFTEKDLNNIPKLNY
jgi:hypothetical protein